MPAAQPLPRRSLTPPIRQSAGLPVCPTLLRARWALPVDRAPIENAALLIGADGRIEAVGSAAEVRSPTDAETFDLGEAILMPGLVNTHTHLELTGFDSTAADADFPTWIRGIRELKQKRSPEEYREAARSGVRDCWRGGVTTVADTGDSGAAFLALVELGGSGIAYQEVFGPHPSQLEESFAGLVAQVSALGSVAGTQAAGGGHGRVQLGVSPHAPYTVSGPLFSRVAGWAREKGLPLAVHVAESIAEAEFVRDNSGPFAEAWIARGIPLLDDPRQHPHSPSLLARTPISYLEELGVLGPDCLCIHAILLEESDFARLKKTGAAVAHCPISNARHRHGAASLGLLRQAGIPVGLGTDSVASVGTLDCFAEMRAAQALAGLSDAEAIAMGTIDGARALRLDGLIGSLTPGKWADVIAIRTRPEPDRPVHCSPLETVVARATPQDVVLTVVQGRQMFAR